MKKNKLINALNYAIQIIENYEWDIFKNTDLRDSGFCQGSIYKNAIEDIKKMAGMEK